MVHIYTLFLSVFCESMLTLLHCVICVLELLGFVIDFWFLNSVEFDLNSNLTQFLDNCMILHSFIFYILDSSWCKKNNSAGSSWTNLCDSHSRFTSSTFENKSVSHHKDIQRRFCLSLWPDRTRGEIKGVSGVLDRIPAVSVWRQGHSLDKLPLYCRVTQRARQPLALKLTPQDNLESRFTSHACFVGLCVCFVVMETCTVCWAARVSAPCIFKQQAQVVNGNGSARMTY